jgi:hypothetical protein
VDNLIEAAEDLRAANYKPMAFMGGTADDITKYKETILPKHLQNFARILLGRPIVVTTLLPTASSLWRT